MATTFLGLDLPTVSVTVGPLWASKVNAAFDIIDLHDHTSSKGVQVPTSGLNINADLSFNGFRASSLLSSKYNSNASTLVGATNANSVYVKSGDLYFTNSAGTAIQITSGGAIVSTPASINTFEVQPVSSNIVISPASTFSYLTVDTTASRTVTLPLAANVATGRLYVIKDVSGLANTNNITILTQGSDTIEGASSFVINSNDASVWVIGNGVAKWHIS
jgi:hypothetical protein